jgi:hypothetical protein
MVTNSSDGKLLSPSETRDPGTTSCVSFLYKFNDSLTWDKANTNTYLQITLVEEGVALATAMNDTTKYLKIIDASQTAGWNTAQIETQLTNYRVLFSKGSSDFYTPDLTNVAIDDVLVEDGQCTDISKY